MQDDFKPKARRSELVVQELPDELLVYDLTSHKAHCLNSSAVMVWHLCNGDRTISDIARHLSGMSDEAVWLAIDQLSTRKLLEQPMPGRLMRGRTRRNAIRAIGLTAAAALPIIVSLTAPRHALASTTCTCVSNVHCVNMPHCPAQTCNANGVCSP